MIEPVLRLVVSLAIVLGLLLAVTRLGARRFRGSPGALITVLHRQSLSRTTSVAVVTVGERVLVLGATESSICVLAELDPEELPEPIQAPAAAAPRAARSAAAPRPARSAVAGSLLSPATWRQAYSAALGRVGVPDAGSPGGDAR